MYVYFDKHTLFTCVQQLRPHENKWHFYDINRALFLFRQGIATAHSFI